METVRFIKTFEVQAPIFDKDGNRTGEVETRIKALFLREKASEKLGNLVRRKDFGSMWLEKETTEEEAMELLNVEEDYSEDLEFHGENEEGFFKVRLK